MNLKKKNVINSSRVVAEPSVWGTENDRNLKILNERIRKIVISEAEPDFQPRYRQQDNRDRATFSVFKLTGKNGKYFVQ